jgi:hypothetical protein
MACRYGVNDEGAIVDATKHKEALVEIVVGCDCLVVMLVLGRIHFISTAGIFGKSCPAFPATNPFQLSNMLTKFSLCNPSI